MIHGTSGRPAVMDNGAADIIPIRVSLRTRGKLGSRCFLSVSSWSPYTGKRSARDGCPTLWQRRHFLKPDT